jgi:hypothetical protein
MLDQRRPALDTNLQRLRAWYDAYAQAGLGTSIVVCDYGHEAHWAGKTEEYIPLHAGDILDAIERLEQLEGRLPIREELERIRARAEDRKLRNTVKYQAGLMPAPAVPNSEDDVLLLLVAVDRLTLRTPAAEPDSQLDLVAVLGRLVDHETDPCAEDHHGNCLQHSLSGSPCAVRQARKLLAQLRSATSNDQDGDN